MTEDVGFVLIVEDHTTTRNSLERVVARVFAPISCATYDQAIEAIDRLETRPAALIVDVHLGGSNGGSGLDVADRARERFGGFIPTLVLTGGAAPEVTDRASELRCELLAKPQSGDAIRRFLERARIQQRWGVADVIDLDRAIDRFAADHHLTRRQRDMLFAMLRAAERGERPDINPNTRKAAIRRILGRTGHASFEELRAAIKREAMSRKQ